MIDIELLNKGKQIINYWKIIREQTYCVDLDQCEHQWTGAGGNKLQSTLNMSKLWGLFFTSSKKSPTPNYGWRKQSKCNFESDRRLEFCRIRDIRVRDIEIRLYEINTC